MSTTTITNLATLEEIIPFWRKDLTEILSSPIEKNHKKATYVRRET